jgi:hypothetical protein
MKADYSSVIIVYESFQNTIYEEMMDIAVEADMNEENKTGESIPEKSDPGFFNKVLEFIKALIIKIGEIFEALRRKLTNRLRLLMETDHGFFSVYNKRKAMVKPYPNIRVVNYKYVDHVLDQPINNILKDINDCLRSMKTIENQPTASDRVSTILESSKTSIIEKLIEPYCDNENITTIPQFMKYLIEKYRGEKSEYVYTSAQIPQIEKMAMSTSDLNRKCNEFIRTANVLYNELKIFQSQASRAHDDTETLNIIASNASKAAELYNAYTAIINFYYEAKLEQSLNSRALLKRFYQF